MSIIYTQRSPEHDVTARALHLLKRLGWQELSSQEADSLREDQTSDVLLRPVLEERLRAINVSRYEDRQFAFSKEAMERVTGALQQNVEADIVYSNEKVWERLRFGTEVRESVEGDTKSLTIRYIDWDAPGNNAYHLVRNFKVGRDSRVFCLDLVLFVNGIPVVVIEAKQVKGGADSSRQMTSTIEQLRDYQRARNIPHLFHFAQLLLAVTMEGAVYGAVGADRHHWAEWRERQETPATLSDAISATNTSTAWGTYSLPGSDTTDPQTFANESDRLIYALCRPARLLDLARWFTLFSDGHRRLARYHQYFAVLDVLERISKPDIDGRRPGGLIWHTQGSGKTLTMVMLSQVLLDVLRSRKPRIVLVTDRVDLDNQFNRALLASGIDCRKANTGSELRNLLRDSQARIITTLIQKFGAAANKGTLVADSPDIFILVDEAHRSQSGQLHQAMRKMLPRACCIGFTGTPVLRGESSTLDVFGDLIGAPYTLEDAIRERTALPIRFEHHFVSDSRSLERDLLEKFASDSSDETEWLGFYRQSLRSLENEERIRTIASDVAAHFAKHFLHTPLKGQIVAPSRLAALRFKRYLDEIGTISCEVVISFDDRDIFDDPYGLEPTGALDSIQNFRRDVVQKLGSEARYENDVITRFKDSPDPKLLIVVNKLLAGFDAPSNAVMYIARPLKSHTLAQALSRVNRPYEGKKCGSIVDYVGSIASLQRALHLYSDEGTSFSNGRYALTLDAPYEKASAPSPTGGADRISPQTLEQSCLVVLQNRFSEGGVYLSTGNIQQLTRRVANSVLSRRKVDWSKDIDTRNRMKTAIEDELFQTQRESGITLDFRLIDSVLEDCLKSAGELVP